MKKLYQKLGDHFSPQTIKIKKADGTISELSQENTRRLLALLEKYDYPHLEAARSGTKEVVLEELYEGIDAVLTKGALLHRAVKASNVEHVEFLLSIGADANVLDKPLFCTREEPDKDLEYGSSPIHYVASYVKSTHVNAMLKALVDQGADINIEDQEGYTAFHLCVRKRRTSVVQEFIKAGVNVNAKKGKMKMSGLPDNTSGWTALHYATILLDVDEQRDVVEVLLAAGADIHCANSQGQTPLQMATIHKFCEVAELLREKEATKESEDLKTIAEASTKPNVNADDISSEAAAAEPSKRLSLDSASATLTAAGPAKEESSLDFSL